MHDGKIGRVTRRADRQCILAYTRRTRRRRESEGLRMQMLAGGRGWWIVTGMGLDLSKIDTMRRGFVGE